MSGGSGERRPPSDRHAKTGEQPLTAARVTRDGAKLGRAVLHVLEQRGRRLKPAGCHSAIGQRQRGDKVARKLVEEHG